VTDKRTAEISREISQISENLKYRTKFTLQELVYEQEINFIENLVKNSEFKKAINFLAKLATFLPNSPRIIYLSASIFDKLSEIEQSNSKLKKSIEIYKRIFQLDQVDKNILYEAGKRLINRLKFIGHSRDAVKYSELLVAKFPSDLNLINELGVNYLVVNKPSLAKKQFNRILKSLDPNNSFALCHLAYILKQYERRINESIEIFKKCLRNNNQNLMDGKFFNQLGDALIRFNRTEEVLLKLIYFIKIKLF
jgi:aspartate beta-hydroxylase